MENKFKVRISRMFGSCKSRDDVAGRHNVVEKSPFLSRSHSMPAAPPMNPLPRPSICKLSTPPSHHINNTCIISSKEARSFVSLSRKNRTTTRKSKSKLKSEFPVSPFEHFTYSHPFYDHCGTWYYAVGNDCGKKKMRGNKPKALPSFDDHDFFCGDDEREEGDNDDEDDERTTGTLFSSRSLSSSESSNRCRTRRTKSVTRTTELGKGGTGVRGSFAVVKKSRDPYGDFRKSMMEMIIERQIFGEDELEQLLLCFLSLNSSHHHKIIVQVYNEIWDDLHQNCKMATLVGSFQKLH